MQQNNNTRSVRSDESTSAADTAATDTPVTLTDTPPAGLFHALSSRTMDVAVSATVLILATPLMLITALLIRLDSPGPVLFRHERVGANRRRRNDLSITTERRVENRHGKPFTLYKYRTMFDDARERFPARYEYRYSQEMLNDVPMKALLGSESGDNAKNAVEDLGEDPRLTRMGKWLRRTSLDELPNLLNVLKGDMALVGPRPDVAENFPNYLPEHRAAFDVKPGVTGLAQVMGRGNLSFHRTNAYDIEYIENRSFWMDVKILFKTAAVVLRREGAF